MTRQFPEIIKAAAGHDDLPLHDLIDMLSVCRPYKSWTLAEWCEEWLASIGAVEDAAGNYILVIPRSDGEYARTLWSSHTDTLHKTGGTQDLLVTNNFVSLRPNSPSSCLGADCTAGAWLMREMALASVPGLYIWHAGEEHGGIGSGYIATQTPGLLEGITAAIAFDRRGTQSIVTHQMGQRCCSSPFAQSLMVELGEKHGADEPSLCYFPDHTGLFTDTANYTFLVPECSNISVGFTGEHTALEALDLNHLMWLRDVMLGFNEDALTIERTPTIEVQNDPGARTAFQSPVGSYAHSTTGHWSPSPSAPEECLDVYELCVEFPDVAAQALEFAGITLEEILKQWPSNKPLRIS